MRKLFLLLLFANIFLMSNFISDAKAGMALPLSTKKQIIAVVEEGPNYLYHILAVARINFDSNYAQTYAGSVPMADIDYLKPIVIFYHG